jgi:hypothetical protein
MSACVHSICVVLSVNRGLATGWSAVQGVVPTVYRIKKLKRQLKPGKRAVEQFIIINNKIGSHSTSVILLILLCWVSLCDAQTCSLHNSWRLSTCNTKVHAFVLHVTIRTNFLLNSVSSHVWLQNSSKSSSSNLVSEISL